MKLQLLPEVCFGRGYGGQDLGFLPYMWESWFCDLLRVLNPSNFHTLKAHGSTVCPSFWDPIMNSSQILVSISLSSICITDDILLAFGYCQFLEKLHLKHYKPLLAISLETFILAFFKGQTVEYVYHSLQERKLLQVPLSFPRLREIELSYEDNHVILSCHILLFSFYKNVKFLLCSCKMSVMRDWYDRYCETLMRESIFYTGACSLDHLYITANHLNTLSNDELRTLSSSLPLLANVIMCCDTLETRLSVTDAQKIGDNLSLLASENDLITSASVQLSEREDFCVSILRPFLVNKSATITDLTLEASGSYEMLTISFLQLVIETCKVLRIIVGDLYNIQFPAQSPQSLVLPERKTLREILLHDKFSRFRPRNDILLRQYITLFNSFVISAPDLQTASITVCQRTESILNHFSSNASRLHIILNDGL